MGKKKAIIETIFGKYLSDRSVNKAEISRKTGLSTTRIARLCTDSNAFLRAYELQLIAMAMKVAPSVMQNELFGHLKLKEDDKELSEQERLNLQILDHLKTHDSLKEKNDFDIKGIERIGRILTFCLTDKTKNEILKHIGLQRKSSNFNLALKTCVKIDWLILKQTKENGELIKTYTTTDKGKQILQLEKA